MQVRDAASSSIVMSARQNVETIENTQKKTFACLAHLMPATDHLLTSCLPCLPIFIL